MTAEAASAQGPDLVQVTFTRAFGQLPRALSPGTPVSTPQVDAAITAGRAAAALPADGTLRDAFVRHLDETLDAAAPASPLSLLAGIMKESLGDLTADRAYLHQRLAEVNNTAAVLVEHETELAEASVRLQTVMRNTQIVPVTVVTVDMRLFTNDDGTRGRSCDPCYNRRSVRLRFTELQREMENVTLLQSRVLAQRNELVGRGADFNRRAQEVVRGFAVVLGQLDERQGGAISSALRDAP